MISLKLERFSSNISFQYLVHQYYFSLSCVNTKQRSSKEKPEMVRKWREIKNNFFKPKKKEIVWGKKYENESKL